MENKKKRLLFTIIEVIWLQQKQVDKGGSFITNSRKCYLKTINMRENESKMRAAQTNNVRQFSCQILMMDICQKSLTVMS